MGLSDSYSISAGIQMEDVDTLSYKQYITSEAFSLVLVGMKEARINRLLTTAHYTFICFNTMLSPSLFIY